MGLQGGPRGRDLKAQSEWPEEAIREQPAWGQGGWVGGATEGCRVRSRSLVLWKPQQGLDLTPASPGLVSCPRLGGAVSQWSLL